MNESLLDRFKMVVYSNYPKVETEIKILESKSSITFDDKVKTYDEN